MATGYEVNSRDDTKMGRREKIIKETRWKNKSDGKNVFEEISVRDVYMNNFKWKFLNTTVLVH